MAVDLTTPEDRDNLFRFLQQCQRKCLCQSREAAGSFELLMKVWQKEGDKLWDWGYWHDCFRCGNVALKSAKALNSVEEQGWVLNVLGWISMEWEDFETAEQYFNDSLHKFESIQNPRGQCQSLRYLGVLYFRQGDLSSSLKYYRQALVHVATQSIQVSPQESSKWALHKAELHNLLGSLYLQQQDFPASYRELHLSLEKYLELGDKYRYFQAAPLLNLGKLHFKQGEHHKARQYYQECHQLSIELNSTDTVAGVLLRLAEVAEAENNEEEALALASEAERFAGTEVPSVRDRAARFRERLLSNKKNFSTKKN